MPKWVRLASISELEKNKVKHTCDETLSKPELLGRSNVAVLIKANITAAT